MAEASPFVKHLARGLAEDARAEVELAVRVGVLLALGLTRRKIARELEVSELEVRAATARLRRVMRDVEP